jgi:hypothetical protein
LHSAVSLVLFLAVEAQADKAIRAQGQTDITGQVAQITIVIISVLASLVFK